MIFQLRQQFVVESFGLEELKDITLRKINESGLKSAYYKSIKERIILLYKKNINNKYNIIKNKVFSMINIIQYHSICFLDCEKYFLEVLKVIYFYDNQEHYIKKCLNEEINSFESDSKNNLNDNENLLTGEEENI